MRNEIQGKQSPELMSGSMSEKVVLGRITGVYGVKGWLKVFSYTDPMEAIVDYRPWLIKPEGRKTPWNQIELESGKRHAKTVVVKFAGCNDRDLAMTYIGSEIAIEKSQLETLQGKDEYYWHDLMGLRVINQQNIELGLVKDIMETGVNDVLVVVYESESTEAETTGSEQRERLIPWTMHNAIVSVDLEKGVIEVDWDADF
jgi:16S rRNA processing protein RimM